MFFFKKLHIIANQFDQNRLRKQIKPPQRYANDDYLLCT